MAQAFGMGTTGAANQLSFSSAGSRPGYQAYLLLYCGYVALPIVAGADKFFHLITDWDMYLAPAVAKMLPVEVHPLMLAAGVIEILAGLLVAFQPKIGAYVVAIWLWGITANLLIQSGFYDIALRDFGLSLGALALGRLAQEYSGRGSNE